MEHWVGDDFRRATRRASILHAIEEHDNGWRELDAAPIVDDRTGQILDFITAPADVRQGVWPRGVGRLTHDRWAAALVAQHAIHIFDRYRSDAAWAPFFATMESLRAEHVRAAGLTIDLLAAEYLFLRVADLISLVFCNAWTGPERHEQYVIGNDGTRLTIEPDPFGGDVVPFAVRARELPRRAFQDAAEAYRQAPDVVLSGTIGKLPRR